MFRGIMLLRSVSANENQIRKGKLTMNKIELNKIINTIVPPSLHTVVIDDVELGDMLRITLVHADEEGTIEDEELIFSGNGTITRNGKFIKATDLLELPLMIREVLARFIVALRDGAVLEEHAELELIAANRQFFLNREEAFVPAGVLCAAGIVDEHNMPT